MDECDELFDRANAEISNFDKTLSDKMTKLDAVLAKLDEVNPIKNPAATGKFDPRFLSEIQGQIESANRLRDDLENTQSRLSL